VIFAMLVRSLNLPLAFATWRGKPELLAGYQYVMGTSDGA